MARKKISAMTAASAYTGANEFYELVQGGNTRQGSHALLKTYFDGLYRPNFTAGSWRAHTVGGFGSTAPNIPYFSTVVTNNLNGNFTITSNNATNGLSITVNTAGLYAVSFWFDPGASDYVGISVNASSVTTSIAAIAAAGRLGMQYCAGANQTGSVSVTVRLAVNDVIRPQINTGLFGTAAASGFVMEFLGY